MIRPLLFFSMFRRTRISRIPRIEGRASKTMRDKHFLIRGEPKVAQVNSTNFYHPDGIRAIAFATFGSYAISKGTPRKSVIRAIRVL